MSVRMAIMRKTRDDMCWRTYGEKGALMQSWWEYKLAQPFWKTVWTCFKKLKLKLPDDPIVPLLGIYLMEIKSGYQTDTCTLMFTEALLTIAKIWKEHKYSLTDEWIMKTCCVYM